MIPSSSLGKLPISESAPSGHDARNSAEYDTMSTEIAKLSSMQGVSSIQWNVVADSAARIIETQSKDIPAATYLAVALAELHGIEGWLVGTRILCDILSTWWDTAFPALKRMRARVNSIDWWHDRAKTFLDRQTAPVDPELSAALLDVVSELDAVTADKMPDCQAMFDLRDAVRRIPLKELAPPPPVPQPVEEAPVTPSASEAVQAEHASPPAPPPAPAPVAQPAVQAAPAPSAPSIADPKDLAQVRSAFVETAQLYFNGAFSGECPRDPLAWRALYLRVWGKLQALPPEDGGMTSIPAPDPDRMQAMTTLLSSGKAEQAARAAALFAPEAPFCLELHGLIHAALVQAGKAFALAALVVEQEILAFLSRLEGVENKRFSDGTPFASEKTRQWLKQLATPAGSSSDGTDLGGILEEVTQLVVEQRIGSALDALEAASVSLNPAERLRLRIESVRLLTQRKAYDVAAALADSIEEVLDRHHLDVWSPEAAVDALVVLCGMWSAIRTAARRDDSGGARMPGTPLRSPLQEKAEQKYRELFVRLARLKPSEALALSGS